jgi:hypothetical protein
MPKDEDFAEAAFIAHALVGSAGSQSIPNITYVQKVGCKAMGGGKAQCLYSHVKHTGTREATSRV